MSGHRWSLVMYLHQDRIKSLLPSPVSKALGYPLDLLLIRLLKTPDARRRRFSGDRRDRGHDPGRFWRESL